MKSNSTFLKLATATLSLLLLAAHADAQLAVYTFGTTTTPSLASTDNDLNSVAGTFNDGPGFTGSFLTTGNQGNPVPSRAVTADQTNGTNEAGAVTAGDYFEFTLTPNAGFQLNLTSLTLDFDASFNTVDRGYAVRSSADPNGAFMSTLLNYSEAGGTGNADTFVNQSIDLSGATFQNLTTPVSFRIYAFDNANSATSTDRFDNVILNGTTTAVPEPTTFAMLLGGLGLLMFRRSRGRIVG